MKAADLFEGIEDVKLYLGGEAKMKKLRQIITPEVYAKAYDLMIGLAAKGMSAQDMDLLAAQLNDNVVDKDEMMFQFQLIVKGLPAEAKAEIKTDQDWTGKVDTWVVGKLPPLVSYDSTFKSDLIDQFLNVRYEKGKWRTGVTAGRFDWARKAFDTPEEALTHLRKEFPKRKKDAEKTLAFIKTEKAKAKAKA